MKVITRLFLLIGMFALVVTAVSAKDNDHAKIRKLVEQQLGRKVTDIKQTPIAGLLQVTAPPMVLYMSKDGRYFVKGDIVDLVNRVNISATARDAAKKTALAKLSKKDMIIYSPKNGKVKHVVTVFTDIDCPYCRKLHNEIPEYNKLGIEIRYLAFPRAGIGSPSYYKYVSAWCAKDRKKAFHRAIEGENIPQKTCKNPVAMEFQLGQELGVNGTPAMILQDGQMFPGYAPPDKLSMVLDQMKSSTAMQ